MYGTDDGANLVELFEAVEEGGHIPSPGHHVTRIRIHLNLNKIIAVPVLISGQTLQ